ncbi:hypothetical protein [Anatilimnocola aggregata]|uniref:hypothetical protein n=1 Tax=Anatilimnocola aggregata TaxID=2528021 RepID=UPI0011A1B5AF|nr:hypothetical protein [Anatilimnocola aggregata]
MLCRVGIKVTLQSLLPIYDVTVRNVGVLEIRPDSRPGALLPQVREMLKHFMSRKNPLVVTVQKTAAYDYSLNWVPLPPGADDGASSIRIFGERFEKGELDIASVYQRITNELLATYPEIAASMNVLGVQI